MGKKKKGVGIKEAVSISTLGAAIETVAERVTDYILEYFFK